MPRGYARGGMPRGYAKRVYSLSGLAEKFARNPGLLKLLISSQPLQIEKENVLGTHLRCDSSRNLATVY